MATYFKLAHGTRPLETTGYPWPYAIAISFDDVAAPVGMSEGVGHGAAGCFLSAQEALDSSWRAHFDAANGLWLIPYLEALAQGSILPKQEMLNRYREQTGKAPASYTTRGIDHRPE